MEIRKQSFHALDSASIRCTLSKVASTSLIFFRFGLLHRPQHIVHAVEHHANRILTGQLLIGRSFFLNQHLMHSLGRRAGILEEALKVGICLGVRFHEIAYVIGELWVISFRLRPSCSRLILNDFTDS